MMQRHILFLIFFLTIPSASLAIKQDVNENKIEKTKIFEKNQITKIFDVKDPKGLGVDGNIAVKTFKQNKPHEMELNTYKKVKSIENLKKNFYLNLAFGNSNLKNYDVYNTSTNEAIWDDRYTGLGSSYEIGIGYDFGKIRTEISYAQEKGRFDEYLTYYD